MTFDTYLTRKEASIFITNTVGIPVSVSQLNKKGPKHTKQGKLTLYKTADILKWIANNLHRPPHAFYKI